MNVIRIRLNSKVLGLPVQVGVILPEATQRDTYYSPNEKFKVLWSLHGASGDSEQELRSPLAHAVSRRRVITVFPSAHNSDYGCYDNFCGGYDFPGYFFDELMPFIYATFPASQAPEDNFIIGTSMGGFGSVSLGLMHPEKFGGIGALGSSLRRSEFLEPYLEKGMDAFRCDALANPSAFPTEYGYPNGIKLKEVNVISKYPSVQAFYDSYECMWRRLPEAAASGKLPKMFIACGTEDLFYPATCQFMHYAAQLGLTDRIQFTIVEGEGHTDNVFTPQNLRMLEYFGID